MSVTATKAARTLWQRRQRRWSRSVMPYLFIIFPMILYVAFTLYPVIFSLVMSFYRWVPTRTPVFVGLANYETLFFTDEVFRIAVRNTTLYVVLVVPLQIVISLVVASIAMEKWFRFASLTRVVYFMPVVVSEVSVAIVWSVLYHPTQGILNAVLKDLGIPTINWLGNSKAVIPSLALMAIWKSMGYYMVIFMAGLSGIPYELYEAAALDGTNKNQSFWYITLPLLRPALLFAVVIACIGTFQVFGSIYLMTGGGPVYASTVITWMIYTHGFSRLQMGYASAIAWVLFAVIFTLGLIQIRLFNREIHY